MKWPLKMSTDATCVDAEEVIVSIEEPSWLECENTAREHGCKWWSLEVLNDDD